MEVTWEVIKIISAIIAIPAFGRLTVLALRSTIKHVPLQLGWADMMFMGVMFLAALGGEISWMTH